jgi:hypothetical protein
MNAKQFRIFPLLLTLLLTSACKSKVPADEAYTPMEGAVGFDTKLERGPANLEQTTTWLVTSQSAGHLATFRIELGPSKETHAPFPVGFGKGRLLSITGSDSSVMLAQLKTALQAKAIPQSTKRVPDVPFTYAVFGLQTRRYPDGGYGPEKTGTWITLKLFFRDGEPEVFLNLNPVIGKGEFSIKDPDYGDEVISELAKVL